MDEVKTLVIDNFSGALTSYRFGNINSGRSLITVCSGQNPFVKPGQLTWSEASVQIDPNETVIQDLIMDGKERVENGIIYVYAVGHTGRIYKIQVNDPSTYNNDYDHPVLLTTLTSNSPTFTRGGSINFFGSTERIYIGHDKGVTRVDFNGTNETFVGVLGSWTQNVPRPFRQFVGKLYIGNGSNIAEIDSTAAVTSYAKLSPGFPDNTQVRDMDFSTDGNYLEMVVSRLALGNITSGTQDTTTSTANSESYIFKWNGTDTGYTTFDYFPSFSLNANTTFQNRQYVFGVDQFGTAVYNPSDKMIGIAESPNINPNAISSTGNLLSWLTPLYYLGVLESDLYCWGPVDFEIGNPLGYWDLFFRNATAPETDIIQVPFQIPVSNTGQGSSTNGYVNNIFGTSKIYFSTLEVSDAPTTKYRFYKWRPIISPLTPSSNILIDAIYQTQIQTFSKRIKIKEVRIYGEPWVNENAFEIQITGSDGNPIAGGTRLFDTSDGTLTVGDDFAWYNPQMDRTYALGIAVLNKGIVNHVISKIEIDYAPGGE